ncbi:SGNH/GDSL hydrolase family protein [Bacteroidota bacterium]
MNSGANQSRRRFIKKAGIGAAALAGLSAMETTQAESSKMHFLVNSYFSKGDVVLFQGDSITDAGRDRKAELPNHDRSFGTGYANIAASRLLKDLPDMNLIIYNRGISGNKVYQLADRWQKDCIDLKPNVLSILIGVNDYWHLRQGKYDGTSKVYGDDYRKLISRTKKDLPEIKLIICEPFILADTEAVDESWFEPFSQYQEIAASLAKEFNATWVPFQKAFNEATEAAPAAYWTEDGVHPSMAGCQLMSETWLKSVGGL